MYKIFSDDNTIFLTDNYTTNIAQYNGLFYKYTTKEEFKAFWDSFHFSKGLQNLFIIHKDVEKLKEDFFLLFAPIYAAGGIVENNTNQYLFIKKRGKWDLPKGKIDEGEDIYETALREIEEECNISELIIEYELTPTFHIYYQNNTPMLKKTYWYKIRYEGNSHPVPETAEDITHTQWFSKTELQEIYNNMYPSIQGVLNEVLEKKVT